MTLGYLCHCYHITLTSSLPQVGNVIADVYVAHDLAPVDVFSDNHGSAWMLHEEFQKLEGMPLRMTLTKTTPTQGKVTDTVEVVSISNDAVPASAFVVPKNYQLLAPPPPPMPSTKVSHP